MQEKNTAESIDIVKLGLLFRKHYWVLAILLLLPVVGAYLYLRYTKPVFESESELRLEIKKPAALSIMPTLDETPGSELSGEIEQIRSRVFLTHVADSLPLKVSYHYEGQVLNNELYRQSPFEVEIVKESKSLQNIPWMVKFTGAEAFLFGPQDQPMQPHTFDEILAAGDARIRLRKTHVQPEIGAQYFFIVHSETALVNYLRKGLTVAPISLEANTIRIAFRDYNALKAYDIVNKIDSLYMLFSNQQKNLATRQKIDWLNNELTRVEDKMESYENYFEQFMLSNKSTSTTEELKKIIASLYRLDSQRVQTQKRLLDLQLVEKALKNNEALALQSLSTPLPEELLEDWKKKQELEQQHAVIDMSHHPNTRASKQIDQRIQLLRAKMMREVAELKARLETILKDTDKRKSQLEERFALLPGKNTEFAKNQRFYKLYEEFYLSMMQSRAGIEITQAGTLPDFTILSPAHFPVTPVSPKRLLVFGAGISMGIFLCFVFTGIAYLLHNKVTGTREIEQDTQLPVLGIIPESRLKKKHGLQVVSRPRSRVSEAIRTLRTNLDFFTAGNGRQVICISSTIGGEGKSFIASNLAAILSLAKKRVLLVDLDMRKKQEPLFPVADPDVGMSTVLIRRHPVSQAIRSTVHENLYFIPAGPAPPNPSELLVGEEFGSIMDALRREFDYIVLDTPPSGLVTDAIPAMKRSDITMYIVRVNYSKREFLSHLNRLKSLHGFEKIAVVLNALPLMEKGYGHGYYEDEDA
jgi:capsular exopolysaccharide synthesis family protein